MKKQTEIEFKILLFIRNLKNSYLRFKMRSSQEKLAKVKHKQISVFYNLRKDFATIYNEIKRYNVGRYTTPWWEEFNTKLEKMLLPNPPFSFLNNSIIMFTMFGGRSLRDEIKFLEKKIPQKKLKGILEEDYIGDPLLVNSKYPTSYNSILQLYHMFKYVDKTRCNLDKLNTIIEWGGGYGNMAKLFIRLIDKQLTYIIIDTPLFSCLQWLYLATIFGEQNVHLIQSQKDRLLPKKINLIPVCFLNGMKIKGDLFVSTWGLSESSKFSQDYVANNNWFNVKHLFIGYQKSTSNLPHADRVGRLAQEKGALIEKIDFLPGNYYAFL